jgi:pimeloyl-ACP methyl ester carboxylesterase
MSVENESVNRMRVRFRSGGAECAAWRYPGRNGATVVMAPGFGVTKEPGTDRFARAFQADGFGVLAFDYRRFGDSGGEPRLVGRVGDQLEDWAAAVACARELPGADPDRVAAWGFSLSGGHVVAIAATVAGLAAAVAQSPNVDGLAATRSARRHTTAGALARVTGLAVLDAVGGLIGRPPRLLDLTGPRGSTALLSTPDALDGDRALDPQGHYAGRPRAVAARAVLTLPLYRPGRLAGKVRCPLLLVVCEDDATAPAAATLAVARRVPGAEVVQVPGGHYAPFLDVHDRVVAAEIDFLHRHLGGS